MRRRLKRASISCVLQIQEALAEIPTLGGGIVALEDFSDPSSGLEGTQYTVTLAYSIGDLAALAVVTDGLSGVGISITVVEVSEHGAQKQSTM